MSRRGAFEMLKILWAGPLLVACTGDVAGDAASGPPRTHTVEIRDMAFHPADIRARPGDTIVWTNADFLPHTATDPDSAWTSPPLAQGESWRMVVGGSGAGTYICAFHPVMEARLTIDPQPSTGESS